MVLSKTLAANFPIKATVVLLVCVNCLSGCMYYASFDRQRAETEQVRQKTALMEAHAVCLKGNVAEPTKCPKPVF